MTSKVIEPSKRESWHLPFAGLMTLLFALFVVLYSISKADLERAKKATTPSQTIENQMSQTRDAIQQSLSLETGVADLTQKMTLSEDDRGLIVRIASREFFDDGVVEARPELRPLLDRIAQVLATVPNSIRVEGHTDIEETQNSGHEDWELSAGRAAWVVEYWIKRWGLDPARLSASGLSHFHPLTQRKDDASRGKNRRVEIIVLRSPAQAAPQPQNTAASPQTSSQ